MKKKILMTLTVISLMLSMTALQGFSAAQAVPGYVGVSKGDRYEFEVKMSKATLDKLIAEMEGVKDDFKNELGSLGDLNFSDFMKEILLNFSSPFLPDGWESLNVTDLVEETIVSLVGYLNSTYELEIGDWMAMNLTIFAEELIEGFNATDYTLIDVINEIVNNTESEFPELGRMMPLNWSILTIEELIGWQMDNFMNNLLKDATGDTFEIPGGWSSLNTSSFLAGMFPGLDINFIEFIAYLVNSTATENPEFPSEQFNDAFFELNMSKMIYMAVWQLNYSLSTETDLNLTIDLTKCDMTELLNYTMMMANNDTTIIPEDWNTMNISTLVEEVLINFNNTMMPGILDTNMSMFIDTIKLGINESLSEEGSPFNASDTGEQMINSLTLGMVYEMNSTLPELYNLSIYNFTTAPEPWYELSINELIDELWKLFEDMYESAFTGQESELAALAAGMKLRFDINNVTSVPGLPGINTTWINFTFSIDPGLGQFQETPWIRDEIYIFDPEGLETEYLAPMEALAFQAQYSMLLFIGKNYDKSKITFRDMTMNMPDPLPDVKLDIDWDENGVLEHASMNYGTDTIISIQSSADGGGIPGYELILLIGISLSSILGLIYVLRKKKMIYHKS
ncbi:MAG: exported protein of unknown function [Promethearchaeota archaeon]|nr:MAG: exported protein of unknown function [Candidatus Lokiarchaeota archaeon]